MKYYIKSFAILSACLLLLTACGQTNAGTSNDQGVSGTISIDGSSTLYPLTSLAAEIFSTRNRNAKITVSESGTGSGMSRFCNGEITIANASREISSSEVELCLQSGVQYQEIEVAVDGISIVVNKDNDWVTSLTIEQLKSIFEKDSKVRMWSDIPGTSGLPQKEIKIYSPGNASGTFEFFTEKVNGTKKVQRVENVTQSEDDNVLVRGIAGDKYGIGYLGFEYYNQNKDKLDVLAIQDLATVLPTSSTIKSGEYPLSRPLFLYVDKTKLEADSIENEFIKFYIEESYSFAEEVGMISIFK